MYLKWKRIKLKGGGMRLQAEIFSSYRDETGKPRRKSVAYIGSVKQRHLSGTFKERGYYEREKFWEKADRRLERLALPPEEKSKFSEELEQHIPRPLRSPHSPR